MKKILSMVLVLLLAVSVLPSGLNLTVNADSIASGKVGKITWLFDSTTGVLEINGNGNIPDFTYGLEQPWDKYKEHIRTLKIADTVTRIGNWAFYNFYSLSTINMGKGVTSIGEHAFVDCDSIKSLSIGENVTHIEDCAFDFCNGFEKLYIPKSVQSIGWGAFEGSISEVYIYDLESWCEKNLAYNISPGKLYLNNQLLTNAAIPQGTTSIYGGASMFGSTIESITIPSSVAYVGMDVFYGHESLKQITVYSKKCDFNKDCGLNYNHKIYGFKGSTAEAFADKIGAEFIDIMTVHTHTETTIKSKAPTCTKSGLTEGKTCSVCDTIITAQKTIPAKGHTYKTTTTKATLKKNGSIIKKCTICGKVGSKSIIKYVKTVKLSYTSAAVLEEPHRPHRVYINRVLYVKDSSGKKLKNGTDYTVKGLDKISTQKVGIYKVTVTLKGNYSGKKVLIFKTTPPTTSIKKLTAAKKSLKVKFSKKTKEVTGYEIQYSTSKKFKSAKKVTFKNAKSTGSTNKNLKAKPVRAGTETTSATLKKLKAKKTYYVRIRTYKVVKGRKYYSAWSKALKKKTK